MSSPPLDDVLILGGGCAGLSLAVELAQRGYDGSVRIIEPRKDYARDRTWCYWGVSPHGFEDCVTHRWNRWRVCADHDERLQATAIYPYEQIPADRFYASALKRLSHAPRVSLWKGTQAAAIRATAEGLEVETGRGTLRARMVFDARPPRRPANIPLLTQHFLGWEVRSPDPVFDPECVTLMDFRPCREPDIAFCYLLPYSEHSALIETTILTPRSAQDLATLEDSLRDYVAHRLGIRHYEIGYREQGSIPMGLSLAPQPRPAAGYHPIGTRGGLVRPSTGYAFLAIQDWSRTCAEAIVAGRSERIPQQPYSRISRWLDGLMLRRLLEAPQSAPQTFLDLFGKSGADATVRFLADRTGWRDYAEVIASLPKWPFLKLALKGSLASWPARPFLRGQPQPSIIDPQI